MSYVSRRFWPNAIEDHNRPEPPEWRPSKWMVFTFFALLTIVCVGTLLGRKPYDGARIAASDFQWPTGCDPRTFGPGDRLPKACFDRFQKISSKWAGEHHLKIRQARRSYYSYYRLGNDAVSPLCVVWEDSCTISWLYRGMFVTDPHIADTTSAGWRTLAPGEMP